MRSTSRLALNALLAGLLLMAMAGPALATTTVSGDLDTNAPLEIDPTAAPVDAQTVDVDLAAYNPTVAFIQRMPVTKVVDRVTLGDFASAPGCGTPAALRLFVYEHAAGDFQTVSSQLTYSGYEELPSTPGRVSWSITPTTLRAGRGYSFYLGFDPGRCRYGRQTTWAHNGATVNAGPARCTNGPPAQPNRSTVKTRMWHTANADDRQLNCSNATWEAAFHASMPQGWLVTDTGSFSKWVVSGTYWTSQPSASNLCGQDAAAAGARVVHWRESPGAPGHSDYVCMWGQYEPLDQTTAHGWYYGLPWKSDGTGAPRDVYLKLDTIDYSAELQEHVPIYRLDSGETYQPLSPGGLAEFYIAGAPSYHSTSNTLNDPLGPFAIANPDFAWPAGHDQSIAHLTLDSLGAEYGTIWDDGRRAGTPAEASDAIDARGDADDGFYDDDARVQQSLPEYRDRVYGRAVHGCDGRLWLQYWVFYYDNPKTYFGTGRHEGDWEMVQLRLSTAGSVDRATYAQHGDPESRDASGIEFEGSRPRAYVAHESHASYFSPVDNLEDRADGDGLELYNPILEEIDNTHPQWLAWPGHWGGSGNSPQGPGHGGNDGSWSDPSTWDGSAQGC